MKLSKAEVKKRYSPLPSRTPKGDQYSWGLSVNLDDAALKKIGLKSLKRGQVLTLVAKVRVTSTSEHDSEEGGPSRDASLQITDLSLSPGSE